MLTSYKLVSPIARENKVSRIRDQKRCVEIIFFLNLGYLPTSLFSGVKNIFLASFPFLGGK